MNRFFFLAFSLIALVGCTAAPTASPSSAGAIKTPGTLWPTRDWTTSPPEAQEIDPVKLEKALAYVKDRSINLDSLLVIRNGAIVSETYYHSYKPDSPHVLYSVTKSVIATLVGIAVDQGKIRDVNLEVMQDFFPARIFAKSDTRKQAMKLENLLSMTSGLDWAEEDASFNAMYRSRDWVQWMMDLPMGSEPGTAFRYCSGCSHVLSAIVQQSAGTQTETFARKNLFAPLGITNYRWETDPQGIAIGGWGLYLAPRDMAKLGYLYLHNGLWDSRQVVSTRWIEAATSKHISVETGTDYGYQWWLYPDKGAYAATGRGGQTIYVVPARSLIIVTTADLPNHDLIFDLIDNYIMPAVQ